MIRIEEYIETIYKLSKNRRVKVKDICEHLNLSPSTVSEMIKKLKNLGYIEHEKYGEIRLTEKGENLAKRLDRKHTILKEFFIFLGIDEKTADEDACKIEHIISEKTISKIEEFLKKMKEG
ncbi:metal-dependent transcriptional regulator [Methanocaldococcus infernus]|uniref:Iron (Metal) dependent repressor, DtxR family n=1 Tax=Methanocaldococcus infernus (strain DSM 11812 / JCM 15783 / ME) TaxID=573063 RepID=D5VR85_METIM|nr:metal-dependent transcriptional regulator [Methanocaldococcus infernus]ADG13088.1 iron (metal) dependent repressor, DtxR family [Methanocaldococcus infernus ME]